MTFPSWLRGLTHRSASTLKRSRPSAARTRGARCLPSFERLEDRNLLAYDLGFAFGLASTGSENSLGVATDAAGNVVVAASFGSASIDLDPGVGTYILSNAVGNDGLAAKYDPAGNLLWGVQVGGTGDGIVSEVEVDGAGNVLIAGSFAGSVDIGAPGRPPITLTNGGISEGYLAKLDPAGNALWARTFGAATGPRLVRDITTDAAGNVYATGKEGENRLFVAKYSADGAAVWSQVVSGAGTVATGVVVSGERVAVDTAGNVLVVGPYGGKIDFNPDPLKTNYLTSVGLFPFGADTFVLKLNPTGAYVWAGSLGGPGQDIPDGLAVDAAGNILVSGLFGSDYKKITNDFDPGPGTLHLNSPNGIPATFVVKLDPSRNLIWARGIAVSNIRDMTLDAAGNVYTTGMFGGTRDFDPGPATFNLTAGGADGYVSKLNSSGNFVWATDILRAEPGSTGIPFNITVDGAGNIFTSGFIQGTVDFDPGAGTYSLTSMLDSSGYLSMDAFVSKLVPSSTVLAAAMAVPQSSSLVTVSGTQAVNSIVTVPSTEGVRRQAARTEAADQAIANHFGSESRRRFALSRMLDLDDELLSDIAVRT